jgi:hypothetical protein
MLPPFQGPGRVRWPVPVHILLVLAEVVLLHGSAIRAPAERRLPVTVLGIPEPISHVSLELVLTC